MKPAHLLKTALGTLPVLALVIGLGVGACGDDDSEDRCEGMVCGPNAHCNPSTGSCVCDDNYTQVGGECVLASCDPDPCNGHGTCTNSAGPAVCNCDPNWVSPWCESCIPDHAVVGEACLHSQMVPCTDPQPANGAAIIADVEITYTDATGWTEPAYCDVDCDPDYGLVGTDCQNSQMVPCHDAAPANATSTVVDVEITYTDAGGWTTPEDCDWECDPGYVQVGETCDATYTIHGICDAVCTEGQNCGMGPYASCYSDCSADLTACPPADLLALHNCNINHIPWTNCDPTAWFTCAELVPCMGP
jgi:hypothetical protein